MPTRALKRKPVHLDWTCMDCGRDTSASNERYSLKDTIWRRVNPIILGMLCLKCVDDRLGRALYRSDFSSAPINAKFAHVCPALAERLRRPRPKNGCGSSVPLISLKKSKTQSRLGRISAFLLQHRRADGRVSRKALAQVVLNLKSLGVS